MYYAGYNKCPQSQSHVPTILTNAEWVIILIELGIGRIFGFMPAPRDIF